MNTPHWRKPFLEKEYDIGDYETDLMNLVVTTRDYPANIHVIKK